MAEEEEEVQPTSHGRLEGLSTNDAKSLISDDTQSISPIVPADESVRTTKNKNVCSSCFHQWLDWWALFTHRINSCFVGAVVALSVHAARNPKKYVVSILALSLTLVAVGFFTNFSINVNEEEIYAPFRSIPRRHKEWIYEESDFPALPRASTLVVHANGDNVLGLEPMKRLFEAIDTVRNTTGYQEICVHDNNNQQKVASDSNCRLTSATRYWYHDVRLFEDQVQTDQDLIETLSLTEYPGGAPADQAFVLGKYETTGITNPTVTYVPAYFAFFHIPEAYGEESVDAFEAQAIVELLALQQAWNEDPTIDVKLEFTTSRSLGDEFRRAIKNDMPLIPLVGLVMTAFTCFAFFKKDAIQSRCYLGLASVCTIGCSLMTGFGLMFCIGVPFTSMTQIAPFVIFGIGLDDTFIITGAYHRTDPMTDPVDRIRITMKEVGSSIIVTTITTTLAFMLGCMSTVPAIQWLCLYSFVTIMVDFVYQVTLFVAFIVLDERRIHAKRRDLFRCCCYLGCNKTPSHASVTETAENTSTTFAEDSQGDANPDNQQKRLALKKAVASKKIISAKKAPTRHFTERLMSKYADVLLHPISKSLVLGAFFGFAVICALHTTQLRQYFDVAQFFATDSYVIGMLDAMDEYSSRTLAVEIYFRNVNQSDSAIQEQMTQYINELAELDQFQDDVPLCWIKDFKTIQEREEYADFRNMTFNDQVKMALSIPGVNEVYGRNILLDETTGDIVSSRCWIFLKQSLLQSVRDQVAALNDQRAVTVAQPVNEGNPDGAFFTYDNLYLLWEFYAAAIDELIFTTVSGVVAVTAVVLLFIPHWSAVIFIFPLISMVYIELLGTLQLAGLSINAVTYVCLVMSIGLLVDFLVHILLRYNESTYTSRHERVKDTLETMGASILLGGTSTLLGVMPLLFSTAAIIQTVFTCLLSMVLLGILHGLVLLPVILSIVGPRRPSERPLRIAGHEPKHTEDDTDDLFLTMELDCGVQGAITLTGPYHTEVLLMDGQNWGMI